MTDLTYGETFKKIRENKGYTKKEVAEGIVSVQFLSKFEKGESNITVDRLNSLLNRIFVSWQEFMVRHEGNNLDQTDKVITEALYLIHSKDYLQLDRLTKYYEERYEIDGMEKDYHLSVLLKSTYYLWIGKEIPKEEIDHLRNHLINTDQWYFYENFLFGSMMSFLPVEDLKLFYRRVAKNFIKDKTIFPSMKRELIQLVAYVVGRLVYLDEVEFAEEIIDETSWFMDDDDDPTGMFFKLVFKGKRALVKILKGDIQEGRKDTERIIQSLELLGDFKVTKNSIYMDMEAITKKALEKQKNKEKEEL